MNYNVSVLVIERIKKQIHPDLFLISQGQNHRPGGINSNNEAWEVRSQYCFNEGSVALVAFIYSVERQEGAEREWERHAAHSWSPEVEPATVARGLQHQYMSRPFTPLKPPAATHLCWRIKKFSVIVSMIDQWFFVCLFNQKKAGEPLNTLL